MTALDVFVFLLLIGGAAIGFVRGFVHEVISLLAWIVAIAMLKLFHTQLWNGLTDTRFGSSPAAAAVLAFAILFVPSFLAVKLVARSLGGKTRRSPVLGPVDRVLGGGFGLLKGLLGATLFFLLANLATDMVYGPQADRPRMDDEVAHLSRCSTRAGAAIVDWVEARRQQVPQVERAMIRLHDTMAREKRDVRARRPRAHHDVCVRSHGLRPSAYRQRSPGGGVRHAGPADPARIRRRQPRSMHATSPTSTTRSSRRPKRRASTPP